jgi:acyl-coenzyme A thioesterase PaaI-like protein
VRKGGRTLSIVDVDVHDETGKLCAIGRGTFFVSAGG